MSKQYSEYLARYVGELEQRVADLEAILAEYPKDWVELVDVCGRLKARAGTFEAERDAAVALLREMVSIADDLSNAVYHRYGGGIARGVWLEKKEAVRAFLDGVTPCS